MARILALVFAMALGAVFARAALDTALALPRIVAQAEERRGW